jgi:hypothetical protein
MRFVPSTWKTVATVLRLSNLGIASRPVLVLVVFVSSGTVCLADTPRLKLDCCAYTPLPFERRSALDAQERSEGQDEGPDAIYGEEGVGMWSYDLIPNVRTPSWGYRKRVHFADSGKWPTYIGSLPTSHTAVIMHSLEAAFPRR